MVERPDVPKEFKRGKTITDTMVYLKNNAPLLISLGDNDKSYSRFLTNIKGPECNRLRFSVCAALKLNDLGKFVTWYPKPTLLVVLNL